MVGSIGYQKRYPLTNVKKFSFADNNATWKARRQAANEKFYAQTAATSGLFSVGSNAVAGQVQLTTQLVQTRLQATLDEQAELRQKRLDELSAKLDVTI